MALINILAATLAMQAASPPAAAGWTVAQDEGRRCVAKRPVGDVYAQVVRPIGDTSWSLLLGPDARSSGPSTPIQATVVPVGGGTEFVASRASVYPTGVKGKNTLSISQISLAFQEQWGAATALQIRIDRKAMTVPVAGLSAMFKELDACNDRLMAGWAIDPALARPAVGAVAIEPERWVSASDFPTTPINQGKSGTTTALFVITPAGSVDTCRVVVSSGAREYDETTCRLIKTRGRYVPAKDAAGTPIPSVQLRSMRWVTGG